MSLPQIGSYVMLTWKGQLTLGGYKTLVYEQGGVQGYGVQFGALKTKPQTIQTLYRAINAADAASTYAGYRSYNQTTQTVIDQFGVNWLGVLVMSAVPTYSNDPLGWMVSCEWLLLPQST